MQTFIATTANTRLRENTRRWSAAARDAAACEPSPTLASAAGGSGDSVALMLHSSASAGGQWRSLWRSLERRFEFLAPDLYGYGNSVDWHGARPFALEYEADAVIELVSGHDKPVHLIGHSYGGAVALKVATRIGERLRSLTLFEPVAFQLLEGGDAEDRRVFSEIDRVAAEVRDALLRGDYQGGMSRFIDYWNGPGAWERMRRTSRESMSRRLHKVALDFSAIMSETTTLASFACVDVPTLILSGECSPEPTRRLCQRLARAIPGARHHPLAGVGHMAPLTDADTVNPVIREHVFLSEAWAFVGAAQRVN